MTEVRGDCNFLTLCVQERELIPSTVMDEIVSLNNLDMELYKHAKILFAKQQGHFTTSTYPQVLLLNSIGNRNGCLTCNFVSCLWRFKVRNV